MANEIVNEIINEIIKQVKGRKRGRRIACECVLIQLEKASGRTVGCLRGSRSIRAIVLQKALERFGIRETDEGKLNGEVYFGERMAKDELLI